MDDIVLGSGLSLSTGATPTLSVVQPALDKAGNTQFGVVEFDPTGDLTETSSNSGIAVIKAGAVTNLKLANFSGTSRLKGSNSTSTQATDISLGSSLSINSSSVLSAAISFFVGNNPNINTPADRPATSNIIYVGSDGSIWIWNGSTYVNASGSSSGASQTLAVGTSAVLDTLSVRWITSPNSNVQLQCSSVGGLVMVFDFHNNSSNSLPNNNGGTFFGIDNYSSFKAVNGTPNFNQNPTYPGNCILIVQDILTKVWYIIALGGPTSATPTVYNVSMTRITSSPNSYSTASLVQFTGGISYPTLTGIGTTTVTYSAFSAYVRYTNAGVDVREIWNYPGGVYTPTWPNGTSQQATYIAFIPDYTTINTTKSLKIIEYGYYRNFPTDSAAEVIFYTIATRDTTTTFFTTFVSFMQGYYGTEYGEKISLFFKGSQSLSLLAYRLTPESSNFGGVIGPYFRLASGNAKVAGRNYLNDIYSTYVITNDPSIQGAASNMTVTVAGRGTVGNEGQQFFRVTGSTAKIFGTSTNVIYEPVDANSTADYAIVAPTKWTYYKLLILPGSRIIVVQPHNLGAYNSAATALATTHIYDTLPYSKYDRWIPTIFVGYMAIGGSFNLNASWTANAGQYAFYDVNKVQYV